GEKRVVAGTGFPGGHPSGDADEVALPGASGITYLPIPGFFIGLDEGARVVYVDNDQNAATFVFGAPIGDPKYPNGAHDGDGGWFRAGGSRKPKISNVRSITLAPSGDLILVEGNGFVRKIEFLR